MPLALLDYMKKLYASLVLAVLLLMMDVLRQPCFFVYGEGVCIVSVPMAGDLPFSVRFLHSVQKTPVLENLVAKKDGSGMELVSTKYQSFGVGLPFMESEGDFRMEGDFYVFDRMSRKFRDVSLRTGVGTELVLFFGGKEYRLYEKFPPGTRIDLFVAPMYKRWLI